MWRPTGGCPGASAHVRFRSSAQSGGWGDQPRTALDDADWPTVAPWSRAATVHRRRYVCAAGDCPSRDRSGVVAPVRQLRRLPSPGPRGRRGVAVVRSVRPSRDRLPLLGALIGESPRSSPRYVPVPGPPGPSSGLSASLMAAKEASDFALTLAHAGEWPSRDHWLSHSPAHIQRPPDVLNQRPGPASPEPLRTLAAETSAVARRTASRMPASCRPAVSGRSPAATGSPTGPGTPSDEAVELREVRARGGVPGQLHAVAQRAEKPGPGNGSHRTAVVEAVAHRPVHRDSRQNARRGWDPGWFSSRHGRTDSG